MEQKSASEIKNAIFSLVEEYASCVNAPAADKAESSDVLPKVIALIQEHIDEHQKLLDECWQSPNSDIEKAKECAVVDTLRSIMDAIEEL